MTTLKIHIHYDNWFAKLMLKFARRRWPEKGYRSWGFVLGQSMIFFSTSSHLVRAQHLNHEIIHALQYYRLGGKLRYWWDYWVLQWNVKYYDKWQEVEARLYQGGNLDTYIRNLKLDIVQITIIENKNKITIKWGLNTK